MLKLAISEVTTYRWSFEEDVRQYVAAGIGAIGVWRQKLADFGEERGIELLNASGLKVSSLLFAGGFTGSDGRTHADSIVDARQAIRLAAALHSPCLLVHSGSRGLHTQNHVRRLLRTALEKLLPIAEEVGVSLAMEPMPRSCAGEWTFLNDLDEALELVGRFQTSALQIVLDTYHWGHHESLLPRLVALAPHLSLVQLGDGKRPPRGEQDRCRLGDGNIPLRKIVGDLSNAGYRGFFEVELLGEEIEAMEYRPLLTHCKEAFLALTN